MMLTIQQNLIVVGEINNLATVATSGSYTDLDNKPTIPNANDFVEKSGDTMTGLLQAPVVQEKSRIVVTSNSFPDLALGWEENTNIDLTLNTNCTISQYGLPSEGYAQTITIYVKGDYALTLPTEWIVIGGTYDPNGTQFIVQSWDDGNFYCAIGGGEIDLSNYLQKSGGTMSGDLSIQNDTNPTLVIGTIAPNNPLSGTISFRESLAVSEFEIRNIGSDNRLDIWSKEAEEAISVLRQNGNVGIGTTNPQAKLEIDGSVLIESENYVQLKIDQTDSCAITMAIPSGYRKGALYVTNNGAGHSQGDTEFEINLGSNAVFEAKENGNIRLITTPIFADNTSASSLEVGTIYRTSDGTLKIKY